MASPNTVISSSERNANDTALKDGVNSVRDWLNSAYNNIFALNAIIVSFLKRVLMSN